jgi:phosphatidylglycerol---prolipoprotein diacylglyceryl transferase
MNCVLLVHPMALSALASIPYIHIPALGPIQPFGVLVASGVLLGAHLLRKYAEWHDVPDDHIRGLTLWVMISGFLGAHIFDVIAYQWSDFMADPVLILKIWAGISSYGGFIGGAIGFTLYVWWKRLPPLLYADVTGVGLLPAFTIGRIGCSVVGDHLGKTSDFFMAQTWPAAVDKNGDTISWVTRHNLGIYEFLYLLPVCAIALGLAFRKSKRMPAGFIAVMIGAMYAPVRFFLDYLRPTTTDPRYLSLTFAQWSSVLALSVSLFVAFKVLRHGKPAPVKTELAAATISKQAAQNDDSSSKKSKKS